MIHQPRNAAEAVPAGAVPQEAAEPRRRVVLRGGLWAAASQVLPAAGIAVLSVVAGRVLGPVGLGRQSLIAYVGSAISTVIVTSLSFAALVRLGALQDVSSASRRAAEGRVVRLLTVAGVGVAGLVVGLAFVWRYELIAWLVCAGTTVVSGAVAGISAVVAARDGWSKVGRFQLLWLLTVGPLGVLAVSMGLGIPGIFGADALASTGLLATLIVQYPDVAVHLGRRSRGASLDLHALWGRFAIAQLVAQVIDRRVEFIALAWLAGDRQIAFYSAAYMIVNLVSTFPATIAFASLPMTASATSDRDISQLGRHLRLALRVGALASLPLAAGVAALGPLMIEIVYGTRYAPAAHLVPLESMVIVVASTVGICNQYWAGRARVGTVTMVGLVAGIVDLSTAFATVPALGATGAVIANVIGQVVAAAGILVVTVRREGPVGWRQRNLVVTALISLAGWGATLIVSHAVQSAASNLGPQPSRLIALCACAASLAVVLVVLATLLKVLADDEAEWIRSIIPTRLSPLLDHLVVAKGVSTVADA